MSAHRSLLILACWLRTCGWAPCPLLAPLCCSQRRSALWPGRRRWSAARHHEDLCDVARPRHDREREEEVDRADRANVRAVDGHQLLKGARLRVACDLSFAGKLERLGLEFGRGLEDGDEEESAEGRALGGVCRELAAHGRRHVLPPATEIATSGAIERAEARGRCHREHGCVLLKHGEGLAWLIAGEDGEATAHSLELRHAHPR
mmetsp:Transcript_23491/g.60030  ORF Transcript_23491/g.60030 Transcript_23491/m.60030 type:complete len:205 (+) Transcript_23491:297-911(+)